MAKVELKTYIENRLLALNPSLDISPGSPAQTEFVEPLVAYLGTDPFETDIDKFLTDRMRQEYPEIYAGDPSAVRDLFIKPLIVFLEPLKREIQSIRRGQSLKDPTLLSDEDADALAANVFDERPQGRMASGTVRIYYPNPTNVPIELGVRFATVGGLAFFPTAPLSITSEEMVFNREGTLYYADIPARAEKAGAAYNVAAGTIVTVDGLYGVAKVTNPRPFASGVDTTETPAFVAQISESLNERSLLNRRGATARLRAAFPGQLRAVQSIGAKDPEMQRDLLVGTSKGNAWLTGTVTLYESLALIQARTVDSATEEAPAPGDTLYTYLDRGQWPEPSIGQAARLVELVVDEVIGPVIGPGGTGAYQCAFLVRWSGTLPTNAVTPFTVEGGCRKKAPLRISSIPGSKNVSLTANDGEVHVFGHTDIYVRPASQATGSAVLTNVLDASPLLERTTLATFGPGETNAVVDVPVVTRDINGDIQTATSFDFSAAGIRAGDLLSVESGDTAGVYVIGEVLPPTTGPYVPSKLILTTDVLKAGGNLRYRISRQLEIDPFNPRVTKLPFANQAADDLQTQIGSNLFLFQANTIDYGVRVGDTVLVKSGRDAGSFAIVGFDATLGGRGVLVDRAAGGTDSNLSYEIFTPLEAVQRPLIRIKELMLLDSAKKSTGITIPPALPVAVTPAGAFSPASVRAKSYKKSGWVLPALLPFIVESNVAAVDGPSNDQRYSKGLEGLSGGVYKALVNGPADRQAELPFPASALSTCSWFVMTIEDATEGAPPAVPRVGEVLRIKSGLNKGGYLIREVLPYRYDTATYYFVRVYGEFPVDTMGTLLSFLADNGVTDIATLATTLDTRPDFYTFFSDAYASLGTWLATALSTIGAPAPSPSVLQTAADSTLACDYEVGTPARGVLRSYFTQPTLFQQHTAEAASPTVYSFETPSGEVLEYRADPSKYLEHFLLPAKGAATPALQDYPRDLQAAGSDATFETTAKPTLFALGIQPLDILEVHEEIPTYGPSNPTYLGGVQTVAGSARVTAPFLAPFDPNWAGNILTIEEGDDVGVYRITDVDPDGSWAVVDRPLTTSTPAILAQSTGATWGLDVGSGTTQIGAGDIDFTTLIGKWVTLVGIEGDPVSEYHMGSFRIAELVNTSTVRVEGPASWPASSTYGQIVVTDAPVVTPVPIYAGLTEGTELYGLRPYRIYQDAPTSFEISTVLRNSTTSSCTVVGTLPGGIKQPYRIYRKNLRRVTPLEMAGNQDGALYYFDTEAVSLSADAAASISKDSYLVPKDGTFEAFGYRHVVSDPSLSYSMLEEGTLLLPLRVLPDYAEDRQDNEVTVAGAPLQITYDLAPVVESVQEFIQSAEDRTTAANMLARHFLPAYVSYDAQYTGGSSASLIAKDIITYIESLTVETPIDVSVVQGFIEKRGGNPETPTKVVTLLHDWSRRVWMEQSENRLGGRETLVPYDGTPRVSYFVPGPDVSNLTSIPSGERIKLTRG